MAYKTAGPVGSSGSAHGDRLKAGSGDAVDARLEGAYVRLGWRRLLGAYIFGSWLAGLVAGVIGGLALGRIDRWSASELLAMLGLLLLIWLSGLAAGLARSLKLAQPLRILEQPADQADLEQAWHAALRWPAEATRWNCLVAAVWCVPASVLTIVAVVSVDLPMLLLVALFPVAAVATAGAAGLFGAQTVMRPILRDLARHLDRPPPPPAGGTSVRLRLLVIVPAITVTMAGGGVLLGAAPGADRWTLLSGLLIAAATTSLLAVPITLVVAHSLLQPLGDLLDATERLKKGDFTTRVPELSGDEYGALARSFNEAMAGLAERQRLAGENAQLLVEVGQLLDEVRASRARIVAASDAERRRVERNIHDGAQQRLVALALDLQLLEELAERSTSRELRTAAERARETLTEALTELRELARGLHPSVLATDGLPPALEQLASRAPVPVALEAPEERFPEAIESTAYFVASEALANVAKYARASRAEVSVERRNGRLVIEISDDGVGGAEAGAGSGLAGLADRVAALNGSLTVESPAGQGTRVKAELPLHQELVR